MVMRANRKRREVEYKIGDMVLVKLQPYWQITLAKRCSNKLAKRYYGPFEVLEHIRKVVYRLALLEASKIHPEEYEGHPVEQPLAICDSRVVLHQGRLTRQVLVQWTGSSPKKATWEYLSEFQEAYPSYHLEDNVISEGEKNVTPRRSKRVRSKPA
ncbi:ty3-gypsy retrotransposon protein [Tanacetum coccineum]|uniref:Ty3-gypsy retrotransposon protein n=1 Tax=Tanacetum coccineum TaxID=301880 RepID=A0ABQ5AJF5_9ASTR